MRKIVKDFGRKVREILRTKNMSQYDVAKILGVHRTYISGVERGLRNPSLITMAKIAKALDVSIEEML